MKRGFIIISFFSLLLLSFDQDIFLDSNPVIEKESPVEFVDSFSREVLKLTAPSFPNKIFDISDFGAVLDDSSFNNAKIINKTIELCHKEGGGKVLVPTGIWYTGAIHLRSNVNLHLQKNAELRFSTNYKDFLPVVLMQRGGYLCYNYSPFIYAYKANNIALTGRGVLNGQGWKRWPWKQKQPGMKELFKMGKKGIPIKERVFGTEKDGVRPPFVQFLECKNILIEDVTLRDGPSWNVHPVFCENLLLKNVSVISHGPNNDGFDIDGCKNVLIDHCFADVGDDNFCLKSGRDEEAWRIGRICENVVIKDCIAESGHGGFTIGSEMSAGVKNVLVKDCKFIGTNNGVRMKSRIGRGGRVENIEIRKIIMKKIRDKAIVINLRYNGEPIERSMNYEKFNKKRIKYFPIFKNISFKDILCRESDVAIDIRGLPDNSLSNLKFRDIKINSEHGMKIELTGLIDFNNVEIH